MEKKYGGQEQSYLKIKNNIKIQINEFVLGKGYVPRFKWVSKEEAKERCKYANVFIVETKN